MASSRPRGTGEAGAAMATAHRHGGPGAGVLRITLYVLVPALVTLTAAIARPATGGGYLHALGLHAGLAGITILALQVILAARFRWIERPFGLDQILRFHKGMAILGGVLLLAHPLLLAAGTGRWSLLWSPAQPWTIWLGRAAVLLLVLTIVLSWFRARIGFEFQRWRWSHNVLGVAILGLGFAHSLAIGSDLREPAMITLWVVGAAIVLAVHGFHKIVRPIRLRRRAWSVVAVEPAVRDVTTVRLRPPDGGGGRDGRDGRGGPDHLPGQFHFVTFHAASDELPTEEHHWTISSSPTEDGTVSSTIKASGDFTAKVPALRAGDTASVLGPYGRFTHVLHRDEDDVVMIAGGIGVTPIRAMIRHLHDTGSDARVTLVYANRTEADIAFREELERIAASDHPDLTVVHVLSDADEAWAGRRGYVDRSVLEEVCGTPEGKAVYLCAPPAMTDLVTRDLLAWGVPPSRIHGERFAL